MAVDCDVGCDVGCDVVITYLLLPGWEGGMCQQRSVSSCRQRVQCVQCSAVMVCVCNVQLSLATSTTQVKDRRVGVRSRI